MPAGFSTSALPAVNYCLFASADDWVRSLQSIIAQVPPLPVGPVDWPTAVVYGAVLVIFWFHQRRTDGNLRRRLTRLRTDLKETRDELKETRDDLAAAQRQRDEIAVNLDITSTALDTILQDPESLEAVIRRLPPRRPGSAGSGSGLFESPGLPH